VIFASSFELMFLAVGTGPSDFSAQALLSKTNEEPKTMMAARKETVIRRRDAFAAVEESAKNI
jgi:hypothetical protein